jgi:hypothetical protein
LCEDLADWAGAVAGSGTRRTGARQKARPSIGDCRAIEEEIVSGAHPLLVFGSGPCGDVLA